MTDEQPGSWNRCDETILGVEGGQEEVSVTDREDGLGEGVVTLISQMSKFSGNCTNL